jgi:hypothetical protein
MRKLVILSILALGMDFGFAAGEYLAIRANGSTGAVNLQSGANLSVTIEMVSGDFTDLPADWWIVAEAGGGWYYYDPAAGFTPGLFVSYQGGLQELAAYEVLRTSGLAAGTYTFYFGVDLNVNGEVDYDSLVYQAVTVIVTGGSPNPDSATLLQPSNLVYRGAFRLPEYPADPGQGWEWGGNALAYYPQGDSSGAADGYPGSLYGAGNDQLMYVGELGIPKPVVSATTNLADLNTATQLRAFRDIRAGIAALEQLYANRMLLYSGLEYLPAQGAQSGGRIYACFGDHFHDEGTPQDVPVHMWTDLELRDNRGSWWIEGQDLLSVNDYLFAIPDAWADARVGGRRLATGRFRDGGWSGMGPALIAIAPWQSGNPPAAGATLPSTTLLLYSSSRTEDTYTINNYHHSDQWSGGAWLTASNKAAVIFIGTKGQGTCWYGYADGTVCPTDGSEGPPPPPYPNNDRGCCTTSFLAKFIFYNPDYLAAVAAGTMASHQPQPYATLSLDAYLWRIDKINHPDFNVNQNKQRLGDCAFDRDRGLLYIVEYRGDAENDRPLVHVFKVQ